MAIYINFVTAPYAASVQSMDMLFSYCGEKYKKNKRFWRNASNRPKNLNIYRVEVKMANEQDRREGLNCPGIMGVSPDFS
jgi:hypothetical protein